MESINDEKIKTVLRHKVRVVEQKYWNGDMVYYKRDGNGHMWKDPVTVIGSRDNVYFIVHQSIVPRVYSC